MHSNIFSKRLQITTLFLIFCLGLVILKLFFVQVLRGEAYEEKAELQYTSSSKSLFDRGAIYLQTKDGTLVSGATVVSGYKVAIIPEKVKDKEALYEKLNSILPLQKEVFIKKAEKLGDPYEEIATRVPKEVADKIKELSDETIVLSQDKWRLYPGESLLSRTLGFVAYEGDTLSGRYGLEYTYNDVLSRTNNGLFVNFFAELFSRIKHTVFEREHRNGDIITTIEPTVEAELEETLLSVKGRYESELLGGIVIDPNNGEIYALSVLPDFDLNNFKQVSDVSSFGNPFVENVYEFGSTVKTLTMAAGIDAGVITPDTTYNDTGSRVFDTEKIKNFDGKGRGVVSMQEVINQSLNTGVAFVYEKLGKKQFRDYFYSFGLKEKTGIDLPGEVRGIMGNLESTRDIEYATASFGQGIAFSPMASVRAFSAIANGGTLITPHLVREISYEDGGNETISFAVAPRVIKEETARTVARMMTIAVDTAYADGKLKLPNHSVAAKTGTAQMPKVSGGGYDEKRLLHSMYGFFPASNPKFLVLLFHVNPQGAEFSSQTLLVPFMDLAEFLVSYYDIPPDR